MDSFDIKDYISSETTDLGLCSVCHKNHVYSRFLGEGTCDECSGNTPYHRAVQPPKKISIPQALRWLVFERDNFTCQHCGKRQHLAVDHIYPESKGGTLELTNLQTLCKRCNSSKGSR